MNQRPLLRAIASTFLMSAACLLTGPAQAHGSKAGDVRIDHPYSTPTPPGVRSGALYFRTLSNTGQQADRLIAAESPVAGKVEFHEMKMVGDIMKMRALNAIELAPGQEIALRHGGELHIMLLELRRPLAEGDRVPVTLTFERGGKVEVMAWVQKPKAATLDMDKNHGAHAGH
ncbi:copper chaperone PCu(A)C [Leptothrix sp. BB-4]